jgi:hypothetical protein
MVALVLPQFERSLRAWPDYGVQWPSVLSRRTGQIDGLAGVNVPAAGGVAEFTLGAATPTDVRIKVSGVVVQTVAVTPGDDRRVRCRAPAPGLAYIELEGTETGRATPAGYRITLP